MAKRQPTTSDDSQDSAPSDNAPQQPPRIRIKGQGEFRHDLFKSDVQSMLKNASFKIGVVDPVKIEHTHIFHTCDSRGKLRAYSEPCGGHFHKIDWRVDERGELVAKCGPAVRYVSKKRARGGAKKMIEPVQWRDAESDQSNEHGMVVDTHVHTFRYLSSEYLKESGGPAKNPNVLADNVMRSMSPATTVEVDGVEMQTDED